MLQPVKKIICFARLQVDTLVAIFLLRQYGERLFSGVAKAELAFRAVLPAGETVESLFAKEVLALDLGGGQFDHHAHPGETVASLVAQALGVHEERILKKLLTWARRDDLEGKGTLSSDPLDRAFGLSGIITMLARQYQQRPEKVVELILPLFVAHLAEERGRQEVLPQEWKQLREAGQGGVFNIKTDRDTLRVDWARSNNIQLPGFLRAYFNIDAIVQQLQSGHINIITKQSRHLDLREVAAGLRAAELGKQGREGDCLTWQELQRAGRVEAIPEWFYDVAANSLQNGGVRPEGVPVTRLALEEALEIVRLRLRGPAF